MFKSGGKHEIKYKECDESSENYRIFNPQRDLSQNKKIKICFRKNKPIGFAFF